jgi:trehalose synthase
VGTGVVRVTPEARDPRLLEPLIGPERIARLLDAAERTRERLDSHRIVNVSSAAIGGGVAELLRALLGYTRGAGIEADWLVIRGEPAFFTVTKRIHNWLYGSPGDRGALSRAEREIYERALGETAGEVLAAVGPGDVAVVHDPQPAGLVPLLADRGVKVVWRCHVGFDETNEWTARAWRFLQPYVEPAHTQVFSRPAFAPSYLPSEGLAFVAPSIDPFSPKNVELTQEEVNDALVVSGLLLSSAEHRSRHVGRRAHVLNESSPPPLDAPLVVQISRWDHLKDMVGVLDAFAEHVPADSGAHLVLAGPEFSGVADDPEAETVWAECADRWRALSPLDRDRIHLAVIPLEDPTENAYVVNALQRRASVIVQKSLSEGFGLTVAEAMWKGRPVVGSAVGGIADQVVDGESGVLLANPRDVDACGRALARLLADPSERARLGDNARRRVGERYLPDRHLIEWAALVERAVA